jgi:hypothetical protein
MFKQIMKMGNESVPTSIYSLSQFQGLEKERGMIIVGQRKWEINTGRKGREKEGESMKT